MNGYTTFPLPDVARPDGPHDVAALREALDKAAMELNWRNAMYADLAEQFAQADRVVRVLVAAHMLGRTDRIAAILDGLVPPSADLDAAADAARQVH